MTFESNQPRRQADGSALAASKELGTPPSPALIVNGLSVDVEDYFQVQALASVYPRSGWERYESRVERNTQLILDLFSEAAVKGTFFTLGWIAERHPALVRRIAEDGHEVASHGFSHVRVDSQRPGEFREDVRKSRRILEDLTGAAVRGYRAATFSVGPRTPWAWRVLEEEGYAYSSSVYPVARDFYGVPDAPRTAYTPDGAARLVEIPISTVRLGNRNWPCGGGGYFRLLPYGLSKAAIGRVNAEGAPAVFYIHPWELDPGQPRPAGAPLKSRLRHYTNLAKTQDRLRRLTQDFRWDRIDRAFRLDGDLH
jgi:polysaccharide deacetylase family protein (PEP-CTERM system associated)